AQSSGVDLMKKWRVMNREAICLQLADKINHLKNNDKIISTITHFAQGSRLMLKRLTKRNPEKRRYYKKCRMALALIRPTNSTRP
ncbi:hypothetical protein MJI37_27040, partial [Salmonella enterica subsp. enterica serovar Cerro]|nr:hypothetical protein [Salmonella enterica subsp. enterica serovar Cerro]